MDKKTRDLFLDLLLGLPGWRDQRSRTAFLQGALWGHPVLERLNTTGGPADIAADLLQACEELDTPTETGLSPPCALLAEIRSLVGTGGKRDQVISELESRLCHNTGIDTAEAATAIPSVLFIAAEPTNEARIRVSAEFRAVDELLRQAKHRDRIHLLQPVLTTRPADLNRAMQEHRPDIVHFSGHGDGPDGIWLEDDTGKAKLASTEALAALFRPLASRTRAVVLNACSTETQAKAIAQHIEFAIGTRERITDAAATAFSIGFYQALGARPSLDILAAFDSGCTLVQLEDIPGHQIPILYRKDGTPVSCTDQVDLG